MVRWVAAGVIVLALVAAVLPSFGGDPGGADPTVTAPPSTAVPESSPTTAPTPTATSAAPAAPDDADETDETDETEGTDEDAPSLYGLISDDPQFSSVENAIEAAGLFDDLENGGPFTLFAPANDAFDALDPAFAGAMNADPQLLEDVLFHHALAGTHESAGLREGSVEMVDGSLVEIDIGPDGITLTSGETSAVVIDADLVASNGVLHVIDGILIPPEIDADVDADVAVSVSVAGGRVVLAGAIGDDAQRAQLLAAVQEVLDPGSVDDLLAVDPAAAADDSRLADLAAVSRVLPVVLVEGSARLAGEAIAVTGVDVDDAARQRLETVTAGLDTDVLVDLERRPVADPLLADTIAADVERLLAEQPLRFVSGILFADPDAATTLDRLAGLLKAADGLDIGVVGFTDTAGNAASNLRTSLLRAEEVENELVRRGVPAEDLTVAGFGETAPVLVDGVEDPAASRRVEIVVRLAEPAP